MAFFPDRTITVNQEVPALTLRLTSIIPLPAFEPQVEPNNAVFFGGTLQNPLMQRFALLTSYPTSPIDADNSCFIYGISSASDYGRIVTDPYPGSFVGNALWSQVVIDNNWFVLGAVGNEEAPGLTDHTNAYVIVIPDTFLNEGVTTFAHFDQTAIEWNWGADIGTSASAFQTGVSMLQGPTSTALNPEVMELGFVRIFDWPAINQWSLSIQGFKADLTPTLYAAFPSIDGGGGNTIYANTFLGGLLKTETDYRGLLAISSDDEVENYWSFTIFNPVTFEPVYGDVNWDYTIYAARCDDPVIDALLTSDPLDYPLNTVPFAFRFSAVGFWLEYIDGSERKLILIDNDFETYQLINLATSDPQIQAQIDAWQAGENPSFGTPFTSDQSNFATVGPGDGVSDEIVFIYGSFTEPYLMTGALVIGGPSNRRFLESIVPLPCWQPCTTFGSPFMQGIYK